MRLTPHFELNELIYSSTAEKLGIDNTPTAKVIRNLSTLCQTVLEPLREAYGKPIYITSGYRGKALNVAVGGARNSDHLHGCAAENSPLWTQEDIRRIPRMCSKTPSGVRWKSQ